MAIFFLFFLSWSGLLAQGQAVKRDSIFVFPNVITPNCDPPKCGALFLNVEAEKVVSIFDRWGKKVYEGKTSGNIVWDSRDQQGKLCETGTYFYLVAVLVNKHIHEVKGNVTVFRN